MEGDLPNIVRLKYILLVVLGLFWDWNPANGEGQSTLRGDAMPKLIRISDDAVSLRSLFSASEGILFEIHPPQRRFKWRKPQIVQLWNDLTKAFKDERESYFLGNLLLVDLGDNRVSVIDGQQRLTTVSILLAVLRDACLEFPEFNVRAANIQQLLTRVDIDGKPVGATVVTPQDPDKQIYVDLIREYGSTGNEVTGGGLLTDACRNLTQKLGEHLSGKEGSEKQKALQSLTDYVLANVSLLPIAVQDEPQGYLVFDTSNTRGLRLSPSEALKARLVVIARENTGLAEELMQRWNSAATKLENAGRPLDAMDDYLRTILSSRRGHIPKRSLDRIAAAIDTSEDLRDVIHDLATYIDSFLAVVAPAPDGNVNLREDLRDLRSLNNQSVVFLTTVHKHANREFRNAVNLVLSLQIRNITFGPYSPNTYERNWATWARLARKGETEAAFSEIRSRIRDDDEFRSDFLDATAVSSATVRHVLRRLDPIAKPDSGVFPSEVEVEHIMPKSVVSQLTGNKKLNRRVRQWIEDLGYEVPETPEGKKDMGEKFGQWLNMLGNQALLNITKNRGAKDRPFGEKRDFYKTQALELTKALVNHEQWGESQILESQKRMAEKAPSIWPK